MASFSITAIFIIIRCQFLKFLEFLAFQQCSKIATLLAVISKILSIIYSGSLEVIDQLADQINPRVPDKKLNDLKQILTLVDGTLFTALPKTVDALWKDDDHKGYKAHVHYELFKSVPTKLTLTDANTSERQVLRENLENNRLYVLDRGYGSYQLMQDIINASSSFMPYPSSF